MATVAASALAPYRTGEGRIEVSGPPTIVRSRQALSLSLAIHELATNALKYGALSGPAGRILITWEIADLDAEPHFAFTWQETGGPAVSPPSDTGFGSRLITRVLKDDFNGNVELSYEAAGLRCRLTTPVRNIETAG